MNRDARPDRSGTAIAVAAAAVTLAVGIGVGALTGYVGPTAQATEPTPAPPEIVVVPAPQPLRQETVYAATAEPAQQRHFEDDEHDDDEREEDEHEEHD